MLYIITENNELKHRVFPLPDGVRKFLQNTLDNYKGDKTVDGYKRLNNILNMQSISYHELKRIKNFFDHYNGSDKSTEFILNGGEPMKTWVNNTLYTATKAIHDFKQAKKDAGISNAFIKSHSKDRQNKKKNKPTQVKFNNNNVNKNILNATSLKYENIIRESVDNDAYLERGKGTKHLTIVINEKQHKMLQEAADEHFSLEELSAIPSFIGRFNYCTQHLGKHIGKGSSRATFQIDDKKVLKLAWNNKGLAQNMEEKKTYIASIFPQVYDYDENGKWLISEFVLPAKAQDFNHCFGMSFQQFASFILACANYRFGKKYWGAMSEDEWLSYLESNEDLSEFDEYIGDHGSQNFTPAGDMTRLCNYGLTQRNGEACIVLLDSGLSEEVWNTYYKRK